MIERSVDSPRNVNTVRLMARPSTWHDPRTFGCVPQLRTLFVAALWALPSLASAQPWMDAYKAGDYPKAADLLHPLVLQQSGEPEYADPEPAQHLATLYAQGLGVPRDPILGCALANLATRAVQNLAPRYAYDFAGFKAQEAASEKFVHTHCAMLNERDGFAAGQALGGCWGFGVREDLLPVGSAIVRIDHRGIRLADAPDSGSDAGFFCLQIISRVRTLRVDPPPDAAPGVRARHFVELLGWSGGTYDGRRPMTYVLQWQMYEVRGTPSFQEQWNNSMRCANGPNRRFPLISMRASPSR